MSKLQLFFNIFIDFSIFKSKRPIFNAIYILFVKKVGSHSDSVVLIWKNTLYIIYITVLLVFM